MKVTDKLLLAAILVIIILFFITYQVQSERVETSTFLEENQIESDIKLGSGESEEIEDESGESVNASGEQIQEIEEGEETTQEVQEQSNNTKEKNTSSTSTKKLTSNTPYYIKVNISQNVVTIYTKDEEGNYTVPYKAMICSVGAATPAAGKSYKVTSYKNRWNYLQGNVYGQYATQIVGNILFHSVPYTAKSNDSLEYWEYDKLGTDASLGCIRLMVKDAKWIYDNIAQGTIVEFYEDANPGPLGKPSASKISNNEACRNWDPTDTAEGNPWNAVDAIVAITNSILLENEMESGNMIPHDSNESGSSEEIASGEEEPLITEIENSI